jgi:diguanylate cyclase (GGDEF)-like protein
VRTLDASAGAEPGAAPEASAGAAGRAPLGRFSPPGWIAITGLLVLCVGAFDHVTGTQAKLDLFYLAPIGFATWFLSLRAGVLLAGTSALVSFVADALHRTLPAQAPPTYAVLSWNAVVQVGTSLSLVLVLHALHARLEDQEQLARTDALTHIPNRRAFFEAASLELERARRHGRPLTLVYLDCDDFKDVNDRLGHRDGDALLVAAAQTLRAGTRAVDAVARLGGDEFGLVLPETDAAEARALLERLRAELLATMARHGWSVGFSIGAAVFTAPPGSVDEMTARADELMYAAKREDKGSLRLGVFGPARAAAPGALPG